MFSTIAAKHPRDGDLPARTWYLQIARSILEGEFYSVLDHEFFEFQAPNGETVPMSQRRPSVQYNLCRIVVQDSVSMLFGDQHFPTVDSHDKTTREIMPVFLKETELPKLMLEAALCGSVGSIAILMRVLEGKIYYTKFETDYLTPEWKPNAPTELQSVTEKYKVRGIDLRAQGYNVPERNLLVDYWFMRRWDAYAETWFVPWTKEDEAKDNFQVQIDEDRTVDHNLGFVPMVWIKNLSGRSAAGNNIDGACTFWPARHTAIEIDYQLSQAGRGLKYASDPELVLKEPAMAEGEILKGQGNAIIVSEKGDAKWLEIEGNAVNAVMDYVRLLRELGIESIRGNRASADRLTAAQSGKALELLHQSLIWLVGELRISYGEYGLLPLLKMAIAAAEKMPVECDGKPFTGIVADALSLRWPAYFQPTEQDKVQMSEALRNLRQFGNVSRETAVKIISAPYDIENVSEEVARIEADEKAALEREIELQAQPQIKIQAAAPAVG